MTCLDDTSSPLAQNCHGSPCFPCHIVDNCTAYICILPAEGKDWSLLVRAAVAHGPARDDATLVDRTPLIHQVDDAP